MAETTRDLFRRYGLESVVDKLVKTLCEVQLAKRIPYAQDTAALLSDWVIQHSREIELRTRETISKSFPRSHLLLTANDAQLELPEDLVFDYPNNWGEWNSYFAEVRTAGATLTGFKALLDTFKDLHSSLDKAAGRESLPNFESLNLLIDHCINSGLSAECLFFQDLVASSNDILHAEASFPPNSIAKLLSDYLSKAPTFPQAKRTLDNILREYGEKDAPLSDVSFEALSQIYNLCDLLITGSDDREDLTKLNQHGVLSRLCLYLHAEAIGCTETFLRDQLTNERKRMFNTNDRSSNPEAWRAFLARSAIRSVSITCASDERLAYCAAALLSKVHHVLGKQPAAEAKLSTARSREMDLSHWEGLVRTRNESELTQVMEKHRNLRRNDSLRPLGKERRSGQFLGHFPIREWMHGTEFMRKLRSALDMGPTTTLARTAIYALFTPWSNCWHSGDWFESAPTIGTLKHLIGGVIADLAITAPDPRPFKELRQRMLS